MNIALLQFRELQDSKIISLVEKDNIAARIGASLFSADAIIAAYAKKLPLITELDMSYFFKANLTIPDFRRDSLSMIMDSILIVNSEGTEYQNGDGYISGESKRGTVTHESLVEATVLLSIWLAQCQREFARITFGQFFEIEFKFCNDVNGTLERSLI